jgi:hypothetical protein
VPVHEPSDTIVAGALERLRAEDKRLGGTAEAALNSLTWDEGLDRTTGRPPDPEAVRRQLAEPLRLLGVLGLSREGGDWQARTVALTGVGGATALEALRARATGPRPDPFRG